MRFSKLKNTLFHSRIVVILSMVMLLSCSGQKESHLFELLDGKTTGIDFENTVINKKDFNIFTYRNFYNGGGVAIGDINNDGLPDLFFTANMGANKLYLNKGGFEFEDISKSSGIDGNPEKWSTGVVMVDVNADGLLDIYVCNAGYQEGIGQSNELYINNGNQSFTESAANYGLDDSGYSTHAAFFDFDLDGDLDVYLLNNSFIPVNTLNYANNREMRAKDWPVKDFLKGGGDKLLRNDNGHFEDISEQAGIYGSLIGFGLGVTVGDINNDQYPDIYVSNDFFERDYLYINQKDGTFSEELEKRIKHTSLASMGADMADINNDGCPEIFATDMLPNDDYRLRTATSFENHYVFNLKKEKGFYNQFMQNSLQLNNQDGSFSEIANFAGVQASDWSWGALMFDADNDTKTDIFVCNGIYNDVIDQDFIDFFANDVAQKMVLSGEKESMQNIIDKMPSVPLTNRFFHNEGLLKFKDKAAEFGFSDKSFSNGAAYGDLDNDGDLDLVINNVNQPCFIYRNGLEKSSTPPHYLKIKLSGEGQNKFAIGAEVKLFIGSQILTRQLNPARGFQSSTEYPITIGLSDNVKIDSLQILWPYTNKVSKLSNPQIDTLLHFNVSDAQKEYKKASIPFHRSYFELVSNTFEKHQENKYEDYYNERNIPMLLSTEGPKAAIGDVNGDGTEDLYICGPKGQAGQLYLQLHSSFVLSPQHIFTQLAEFEDTAAAFFDADGDGDLDLLVGSGGNESNKSMPELPVRLYRNNGKGKFEINTHAFPPNAMNLSVFAINDYDQDGDLDVFVGARSVPGEYGSSAKSYLFKNNGKGEFVDIGKSIFPELSDIGMVRDAIWTDLDGDQRPEILIVGDWMAPAAFKFSSGRFVSFNTNLEEENGFWGSVRSVDLDKDGDTDLVLGNMGENFSLSADKEHPLKIWINDFNKNGVIEKILTKTVDSTDMTILLKRELTTQFPFLKKKSLKHTEFATRSIQDLLPKELLNGAQMKKVNVLSSIIAINDGKGKFKVMKLPELVQKSCVNAIEIFDVNKDNRPDIILAGNFTHFIPQLGTLDACQGDILINRGDLKFEVLNSKESGLKLDGEVKQMSRIEIEGKPYLLNLVNNSQPQLYKLQ